MGFRFLAFMVLVLGLGFGMFWFVGQITAVNEPNPKLVKPAHISKLLGEVGIPCRADKILYINRDFNAYIFEGDLLPLGKKIFDISEDRLKRGDLLQIDDQRFGSITNINGVLRIQRLKNGITIVGIIYGAPGQIRQGIPTFDDRWNRAVGAK